MQLLFPAYKSQSLAALQEQNPCSDHQEWVWSDRTAAWSSTKIVVAVVTLDLCFRRHMMLQQVLPAENMEEHVAVIHPRQTRWQLVWVV
jgi:hypothetical protein